MADRALEGQRRAVTAAALLPAAVGLLHPLLETAGSLAWLCPVLALPGALALCWAWRRGRRGSSGIWGKALSALYLAWGVILLWGSAAKVTRRLTLSMGSEGTPWLILTVILILTIYLTRREEILGRAGKLFFPAVVILLAGILLLSLPSLRWENLFPAGGGGEKNLLAGAAWALSLSGYAVYGGLLPTGGEGRTAGGVVWSLWLCGGLSALLLALVGAFGATLCLRMDEPFLYLLSGVGLPGAFQRGESLLSALGALGDLALLGLLAHGCRQLWTGFFGGAGWVPAVIGGALALVLPGLGSQLLTGPVGLIGNLILGAVIPLLAGAAGRGWLPQKKEATFCGEPARKEEDIGPKSPGKKT